MAKDKANGKLQKPIHDPDVDRLVRAVRGLSTADLYHNSYLSRGTIKRLRDGKTSRPQHLTMVGIAQAAGMKYELVKK